MPGSGTHGKVLQQAHVGLQLPPNTSAVTAKVWRSRMISGAGFTTAGTLTDESRLIPASSPEPSSATGPVDTTQQVHTPSKPACRPSAAPAMPSAGVTSVHSRAAACTPEACSSLCNADRCTASPMARWPQVEQGGSPTSRAEAADGTAVSAPAQPGPPMAQQRAASPSIGSPVAQAGAPGLRSGELSLRI